MVTVIYAIYAVGVIGSLFLAGQFGAADRRNVAAQPGHVRQRR
jgi:hypothetical protein